MKGSSCVSADPLLPPFRPSPRLRSPRFAPSRQADLQRLDILINGEAVDALARIVHRDRAAVVGGRAPGAQGGFSLGGGRG